MKKKALIIKRPCTSASCYYSQRRCGSGRVVFWLTWFGERTRCDCENSTVLEPKNNNLSSDLELKSDSRIAHVDPWVNLMEVSIRPVVKAALVRQQVVELLERHLEVRHVGWLTCFFFNPHTQRSALSDSIEKSNWKLKLKFRRRFVV